MKLLKRFLFYLSILIVAALIAGYFLLNNLKNSALPDYSGEIEIPGLSGEVMVLRDSLAIPHIFAGNENDMYRAVGFVMAQDRLWQMDLLRRVTQGRLSEILGKDQLQTDLLLRALRFQEKSEKILAQSSPEIIAALEAFSEGINFHIANYPLPPEFKILGYKPEPWEPIHSINLIGYMSWDLTSGWKTEMVLHQLGRNITPEKLNQFIPDLENHPIPVYPGFSLNENPDEIISGANAELEKLGVGIFSGSNNWAVSGEKSKTGKPLLANDMHLGFMAPGIWYQMHQYAEGSVNVTGLVLPGQPFVICGHNDSIAWGMTNVAVDDLDFYAETLNEDSTKYLLDGQWKNLEIKEENIHTKEKEIIRETLRFTHRGPIVNRFKDEKETPLSIRWLGNEMSNEIRGVYLLNRARNWADFREATQMFKSVSQNMVYADVAGNIGLQCAAGVPIRKGSKIAVYPGNTSLYDWTGLVPFEQLPYEYNPERGYVSSANNKTAPNDYPYYIGTWFAMPNRIDRIREMLEEIPKHGVEDFKRIQIDFKSKKAEEMTPLFLAALMSGNENGEIRQEALNYLYNWNFVLSRDSQAASIFEILYRKVAENLVKDDLSPELLQTFLGERILVENMMANVVSSEKSPLVDDSTTPEVETWNNIVNQAFTETLEELTGRFGSDTKTWNWGKIHTLEISHPLGVVELLNKTFHLNRGPFPVPGSYHTVSPFSYSYTELYQVKHGASHRHVFDLSNWDASETVIPTGTSGIPASDFYMNQTEMYIENRYHADPFHQPNVSKAAFYTTKLLPAE